MYSDFAVNKYLHTVASDWIFISIKFPVLDGSQNFITVNIPPNLHISVDVRHHQAFSTNPQERGKYL